MIRFVSVTCRDCLDDWSVVCSEKSLPLTIAVHQHLSHEGQPISYCVEPVTDDEEVAHA